MICVYFFIHLKPTKTNFSIFSSDWFVEIEKNSFISLCLKSSFLYCYNWWAFHNCLASSAFSSDLSMLACVCVFVFEFVFRFYVYCTYNNMWAYYVRRYLICTFSYPLKKIVCNMCRVHRVGNENDLYGCMHKMTKVTQYFFFYLFKRFDETKTWN